MHLDVCLNICQETRELQWTDTGWQSEEVVIGFVFSVYLRRVIALVNGSLGYGHSIFKSGTL